MGVIAGLPKAIHQKRLPNSTALIQATAGGILKMNSSANKSRQTAKFNLNYCVVVSQGRRGCSQVIVRPIDEVRQTDVVII